MVRLIAMQTYLFSQMDGRQVEAQTNWQQKEVDLNNDLKVQITCLTNEEESYKEVEVLPLKTEYGDTLRMSQNLPTMRMAWL